MGLILVSFLALAAEPLADRSRGVGFAAIDPSG
jgi:hypothetical protein